MLVVSLLDLTPTASNRYLFKRSTTSSSSAAASSTDSSGCVICSTTPSCPSCSSGQSCVQTVQSCSACATTYCKTTVSSSTTSKTNVGAIAGGVIGGVLVLALLFYVLYRYYFKHIFAFNRVQQKEYYFDDDIEINFRHNLPPDAFDPNLTKPASRSSLATTILSRASNIIPIAYIPGVTIGSNSGRLSTISQTNTISSEFLAGDRFSNASIVGNPSLTTTAIRAKPKLVTINSSEGLKTIGEETNKDSVPGTAISATQLGGVRSVRVANKPVKKSLLQSDMIIEEEGSDIESLVPMKNTGSNRNSVRDSSVTPGDDYDPFILDDDEEEEGGENKRESKVGSVILEVDLDTNSVFNPFDDEFGLKADEAKGNDK